MDKEDVIHVYDGILLSHTKERNSAISRDKDRPRDCHTERVKSEREKQISYDIILEKEMESGKMEQKNVFAKHK